MQIHKASNPRRLRHDLAPLEFRIESRFVKRPTDARNFNWSLMWSFNTKESALAMIKSLREGEGDNPIEEYRLTRLGIYAYQYSDDSFTSFLQ